VKDKRVLALVKAFLKAGVMTETGHREGSDTGTPPCARRTSGLATSEGKRTRCRS
jgi:hypothetical protein